ncbi:MAG: peptidase M1 [Saprospiraceae bacterium]|nr:peptidase M1 [Saprospiraceae bacterium]
MKQFLALMFWCGMLLPAHAQSGSDWTDLIEMERKAHQYLVQPPGAQDRAGGDGQADIVYGQFQWTVNPAVRFISGRVMYRFEPQVPLERWILDLSDSLLVDEVRWQGQTLSYTKGSNLLTLQFPQALPVGLPAEVEIQYHGVPPKNGFGAFETTTHAGKPVLWTLSEPYGARDWFPCQQDLNDKIDSCDIFISAPAGNRPASNGLLVSETTTNGVTTAHWRTRYPTATYLLCMAVTNYAVFENHAPFRGDTTLVQNYVYPENLAQAKDEIAVIVPQLQLFDSLFGMYPFQAEKYGHAQFNWGGGMEHQTMTFVVNYNFELLGHELAHHWFGDKVTCGSWEDIWLNEGFATYLAGLCYEHLQPQGWRPYRQIRLNSVTSQPGGSVRVNDTTSVSRVFNGRLSYAKGALVLHQLRWIMGDQAFFAALRAYLDDPELAYSYARTHQLQAHLEQASGIDLDGYFADWYHGEGFPSYQVFWSQDSAHTLAISLNQTQSVPASVSFFEMPVPLRLYGAGGRDTLLVLPHDFSGQAFSIPIDFQIDSIVFDPDLWLISANNAVVRYASADDMPGPALNNWSISPNPTHETIGLRLNAKWETRLTAVLYAMDGKRLQSWYFQVAPGDNAFRLPLPELPAGVYPLVLEGKGWRETKPIVVD